MRYLPFAFTRSSELARAIRSAAEDPQRRTLCGTCGGRMPIRPEVAEQTVRCPHCWRWQQVTSDAATPWRLSESAALALRRTRSWVRQV
ncbi:MAG TPA: hypothetical protein VLI93_16880 [Acetobacteraceae bacterium]|nr:hypothetical protein [Acetobacteraceae bacterium]